MASSKKKSQDETPASPFDDMDHAEAGALLEECEAHEEASYKYHQTIRNTWEDKESMLISKLSDSGSAKAKSQVYDPIMSTLLFDRGARVMAQNPSGKAMGVSEDDLGKNMVMNLLVKHYRKTANEQLPHLLKNRMLDIYSGVYGSMFALVPWRVNSQTGYYGPELNILKMRDCRPQPGKISPDDSDWFGVKSSISTAWLKSQDQTVWKNVDNLCSELKRTKDGGDGATASGQQDRSILERVWYPSLVGDATFPMVDIYTEYRRDMWITWTPRQVDNDKSRPWILRLVRNPYPDGMLPIVKKDCFPLIDSMIGLGEFERGKTLQFAINSLINLYLDGVKYSIFPPLHINLGDGVVPSSIKWGAGERWYMNNPNKSVQPMNLSPQGLQTFNSTYGFMLSAVYNMFGTAQVSQTQNIQSGLGKTPKALDIAQNRETARDEWDRFMMEQTLNSVYKRWVALISHNLEKPQGLTLFKSEIEEIQKIYPEEDIFKVFKSGNGKMMVDGKKFFREKATNDETGKEEERPIDFDYEIETGSTLKPQPEDEQNFLLSIVQTLADKPWLYDRIVASGKDIDFGEIFKRLFILSGQKDWDRLILEGEMLLGQKEKLMKLKNLIDTELKKIEMKENPGQADQQQLQQTAENPPQPPQLQPGQVPPDQLPPGQVPGAQVPPPAVQQVPPTQPPVEAQAPVGPEGNLADPAIRAVFSQVLGGARGIPPTNA